MTPRDRDFEEILGRALHAAVDPLEPSGDGLDKIRQRLAEPWLLRQLRLLLTEGAALAWVIAVRLEPVITPVRARAASRARALCAALARRITWPPALGLAARLTGLPRYDPAHRQHSPGGKPNGTQPRLGTPRLRRILAVAGAIVVVAASVYALGQLRETVSEIGLATGADVSAPSSTPPRPSRTAHHRATRSRSHPRHHAVPVPPVSTSPTPSPTHSCKATTKATPRPKRTATSSATPSVTPSATVSPSPSPTSATPTPSTPATPQPATTPAPATGPTPSATSAVSAAATRARTTMTTAVSRRCAQPSPLHQAGGTSSASSRS